VAYDLYVRLKASGANPWMDKENLYLGDDWEHEVKRAVSNADLFLVCLRPGFDDVGFRQKEVRWALEALELRPQGKGFFVPFLLEPCEIPAWCAQFHAGADSTSPGTLEELFKAIEKHTGFSLKKSSDVQGAKDRSAQVHSGISPPRLGGALHEMAEPAEEVAPLRPTTAEGHSVTGGLVGVGDVQCMLRQIQEELGLTKADLSGELRMDHRTIDKMLADAEENPWHLDRGALHRYIAFAHSHGFEPFRVRTHAVSSGQ